MSHYLLAIDQGTTNSRAIIFNRHGELLSQHEIPLQQSFPHDGWVEQDAEEMYRNVVECSKHAIQKLNIAAREIAAIGLTNQRETTIIWDRLTGQPIYPAIVWQDRRTSSLCKKLATPEIKQYVKENTGLLLDPYFSATKIMWLLENIPLAHERAKAGDLLFGTVETYLLWKLTGGKSHATDATNASRTMLFNIRTNAWDNFLLKTFNIPESLLPIVLDNAADFGETEKNIFGVSIPISGMAGDQQAATIGQACFNEGMVKATYGTGAFMLLNTGSNIVQSNYQLLSTIAYRLNNKITYGLEGSIFSAGSTIKWLRDHLKIIHTAAETEILAQECDSADNVSVVPAFTGLGAPYWDPTARAAILGLSRNTNRAHIVRAALESVGYQTRDLLNAMHMDTKKQINTLRVDGGMVANNWLMQFLADILDLTVQQPHCIETTALGAAYLAGLQIGIYQSLDEISEQWKMNSQFVPHMLAHDRENLYHHWQQAVQSVIKK